ncbi:hypothetical protein [Bacillus sp. REN3]|uniref:hypothetical protein n=1 Tax=Bacillus sp. REN3 TaxID=2802440 RepID=UPI001AED6A19|nr:hypothetical protein [Bacillus sp. REN3]
MRWVWILLLLFMGMMFLGKGIELWSALQDVSGSGVSIRFIGIHVSDHVLKESLPGYVLGFIMASFIPFMVAINLVLKKNTRKNIE